MCADSEHCHGMHINNNNINRLKQLHVNDANITSLATPVGCFSELAFLSIGNNPIASFDEFMHLNVLPKLTTLRNSDCLVCSHFLVYYLQVTKTVDAGVARSAVICRMPNILVLNASVVRPKERTDAEKTIMSALPISSARYEELLAKYGT